MNALSTDRPDPRRACTAPRLPGFFLALLLPGEAAATVTGDLNEEYADYQRPKLGRWRADLWYWWQAIGSLIPVWTRRLRRSRPGSPSGRRPSSMHRNEGGWGVDGLMQDLGYAARRLLSSPGFAGIVVLTLALGIGANTALFSVIDAVLLEPLPYDQPDRIVRGWAHSDDGDIPFFSFRVAEYKELTGRGNVFEAVGAEYAVDFTVTGLGSEAQQVEGRMVTSDLFDVFGVAPARGRMFSTEEIAAGDALLVVATHGFWQRAMGADPAAIGGSMQINGNPFTLIGVLPEDYRHISPGAELFIPYTIGTSRWVGHWFDLYARMQPGVPLARAGEEFNAVMDQIAETDPRSAGWHATAQGLHEMVVGDVTPSLWALLGTVGLVLLIACVNVANLSLARSSVREGEIAVRKALGASRWRIMRQLLAESVLLAGVGGLLGVFVATWGVAALLAVAPDNIPRLDDVSVNGGVLGFALLATALTAVLFGLAPALSAGGLKDDQVLKGRTRGSLGLRQSQRALGFLVTAEVSLALVLLVGAGLMVKTLQRLQEVEVGFDQNDALVLRVMASGARYQTGGDVGSFYDRARSALSSIPGVESVGAASDLPLAGAGAVASLTSEVRVQRGETEAFTGLQRQATAGLFEALGTPILAGRGFQQSDNSEAPRVMIISRTMSDMLFPDGGAVGRRVAFGSAPDEDDWHEVVGVVGDVRYRGVRTRPDPQIYQAHSQFARRDMFLVLRTAGDPTALLEPARAVIRALDPDMPVYDVTTLTRVVGDALAGTRFSAWLFSVFAALALFLASAGIYGVLSFTVAQRRQEIGVRMALGAGAASVTGLVVGRGMALVGAGLILGTLGSLAVSRVFESLLFEVDPTDVGTLILVSGMLGGTALLACYLPARRARRVDPMAVLRED